MGSLFRASLLTLVFLSVVFITSSLAEALYGTGSVYVCVSPADQPYTFYYLQYGDALISLDDLRSDFHCGYVPAGFAGKNLYVVVDKYGMPEKVSFPARLLLLGSSSRGAAVVLYYEKDSNSVHLSSTGEGVGYLRVDVNVPKAVASFDKILGPAVIYQTDPLLHIYLRAERGSVDVTGIVIRDVSSSSALSKITARLDFAACALHVSDFSVSGNGGQILVRFRILDGNTPVYIRDVTFSTGNDIIHPQFSTESMSYSVLIQNPSFPLHVHISAPVHGCSEVAYDHVVRGPPGRSVPWHLLVLAASLILFGVAVYHYRSG